MTTAPHGMLPVFQTPWRDDDTVDRAVLARELDWLLAQGSDGVVMAMVSETLRMSSEERDQLAQTVCELIAGRGQVVISVGAESTRVALRHAQHAEACGATALMAIPPIGTACDGAELLNYFRSIIKATRLPLIVQDASGYVGRPLPISMLAELLEEFGPDRVQFKPEAVPIGPRLTELRTATAGEARVFEGSGGIALVDSYRRGIVGTMPGADLIVGIVALWKALEAGDEPRIVQLGALITNVVALQVGLDGFLAIEKYLLVKQRVFDHQRIRGPVAFHLDEATRQEVDRRFAALMHAVASPLATP
jgi:dihydrodipicolinate synthase/N-acetylneuraminate lyase